MFGAFLERWTVSVVPRICNILEALEPHSTQQIYVRFSFHGNTSKPFLPSNITHSHFRVYHSLVLVANLLVYVHRQLSESRGGLAQHFQSFVLLLHHHLHVGRRMR